MVAIEPDLAVVRGRFWAVATPRLAASFWRDRPDVPDGLRFGGWPLPTGRPAAGQARRPEAGWRLDLPRAAAGVRLGRWAVTAGLMTAAVGPGLDGDGLTLTAQATSLPQIVLRRTAPLRWSGVMRPLAPQHVLLRAGWSSAQTARYRTEWGWKERRVAPVFSQWLLTWNHTAWWRTTVTHAALAAPREGETLWGDIPQINLPLLGATLTEQDYGPLTDRLFSLGMELRFRQAPWPLLPRAAGRLWWEYGGEDFRPHDRLPILPDIAAPASLVGCELVDVRWDIGVQYLETRHPRVLWYGSTDFARGYTHDGIVLGHPLGGAVEAVTGVVRLRPGRRAAEWELRGRRATWAQVRGLPATARRDEWSLSWRRLAGSSAGWTVAAGWVREIAGDEHAAWFTARLALSY